MIRSSIHNTKVLKEPLVEEKYQNNYSSVNDQNEDRNYMDSDSVKEKYNTHPIEATEYTKQRKNQVHKNQNHNIIFKDSLKYHNIGLILILTGLKITLLQRILIILKAVP